jgi:hypothetical protein
MANETAEETLRLRCEVSLNAAATLDASIFNGNPLRIDPLSMTVGLFQRASGSPGLGN